MSNLMHGGTGTPPCRLCQCGHTKQVHRPGYCNISKGCDCKQFTEPPTQEVIREWWGHDGPRNTRSLGRGPVT